MKDLSLLIWLTQLGLSVAVPPACFVLLAVWLHSSHGWGIWVIWVGLILGLWIAIVSFRSSLQMLEQLSKPKRKDPPPVSFNEHE